jgi:hypothetical protein
MILFLVITAITYLLWDIVFPWAHLAETKVVLVLSLSGVLWLAVQIIVPLSKSQDSVLTEQRTPAASCIQQQLAPQRPSDTK